MASASGATAERGKPHMTEDPEGSSATTVPFVLPPVPPVHRMHHSITRSYGAAEVRVFAEQTRRVHHITTSSLYKRSREIGDATCSRGNIGGVWCTW
jgi:hypothetical protein